MFEALLSKIRIAQAEFQFELARADDPYRLELICNKHALNMANFRGDATEMVKELEEGQ